MKSARGGDRRRRFPLEPVPILVQAVGIDAELKELLARLLQAMNAHQSCEFESGDATVATRYVGGRKSARRHKGWILIVQRPADEEPCEIDVGAPPTKADIGWINQPDGSFIVVGPRIGVVTELVRALGQTITPVPAMKVG